LAVFEPNVNLIQDIRHNLEKFKSHNNWKIEINEVAVSSSVGRDIINISQDDGASSMLPVEKQLLEKNKQAYQSTDSLNVEVITLDAYCDSNQINAIDILKSDTQGNDLNVLKGAEQLLRAGKIGVIGIELYFSKAYVGQAKSHEIMAYLDSFDYHLVNFDRLCHTDKGYLYFGDATFISNSVWNKLGYM
jgi:FkbM family methyltransferase